MAIKGEIFQPQDNCDLCGGKPFVGVCNSAAGYYWGSRCSKCGQPFSRESQYYPTAKTCQDAFSTDSISWRDTKYHQSK
jgi:hypothetical protein